MEREIAASIETTKQGFEETFRVGTFYKNQTQDEKHLESIISFLNISDGMRILDLGTGMGYLAFEIAKRYKKVKITGLDIVEKALCENRKIAAQRGLDNLDFVSYGGVIFPFDDNSFDMVITRYALHHFPVIKDTVKEIYRVLKRQGSFFLSDPAPNDDDTERFVDEYMRLKKDGHIKLYTKQEWKQITSAAGLEFADGFDSIIRFPKQKATADGYEKVIAAFDPEIVKGYDLKIDDEVIWLTENVNNLKFVKK